MPIEAPIISFWFSKISRNVSFFRKIYEKMRMLTDSYKLGLSILRNSLS